MSAPFVGKQVIVVGTSRADLNGSIGTASDYDREKGRYNVRLTNGQVVALRPANLDQAPQTSGRAQPADCKSSTSNSTFGGISWPTLGLMLLGAAWVFQALTAGQASDSLMGLFGSEDTEYDDADDAYLRGQVREVATLDQLRGALAHHSENTGLPVVVDFFSHSCGPCRMIAPAFKRLSSEVRGEAVFKSGCKPQLRGLFSMPRASYAHLSILPEQKKGV